MSEIKTTRRELVTLSVADDVLMIKLTYARKCSEEGVELLFYERVNDLDLEPSYERITDGDLGLSLNLSTLIKIKEAIIEIEKDLKASDAPDVRKG